MRAAPLPPPVPAQRKVEEGKNGYTSRGPKWTKTSRLTVLCLICEACLLYRTMFTHT
jgi:hypothetical protein